MPRQRPFRLLLKLFQNRFFENDTASPDGGFQTNINGVLGILGGIGTMVGYFVMPAFLELSLRPLQPGMIWGLRNLRLFFPAYAFAVAGFAAVFQWDLLFPDRRDFLILTPFPIRLRELVAAKFTALMVFLLIIAGAVNIGPDLFVSLASLLEGKRRGVRLALAHICATGGASVFAFLAVVAVQGILISVTSAKVFRRISPWIQMVGMSAMVLTVLAFPVYSAFFRRGIEQNQAWLYWFPPAWFSGIYELFLGGGNAALASLGMFGLVMTGIAALVIATTWTLGFQRHFRRTLESEDAAHRPWGWRAPRWLLRNAQERTIFSFIGKTIARSQKHQFFLAAYLSAGLAVAAIVGTAVQNGRLALSPGGARAVAFIVGFFLISGLRAAFQFPAELSANWIFQITEGRWTELSRRATRKLALGVTAIGSLLIALPYESEIWRWPVVLEHTVVQTIAAALLIEALFWSFDRVPFTCSYFPGRKSLPLLVIFYAYGVTGYSFNLADLEAAVERKWTVALLPCAAAVAALAVAWRRRPVEEAVRFDGSEPVIQTLDLT